MSSAHLPTSPQIVNLCFAKTTGGAPCLRRKRVVWPDRTLTLQLADPPLLRFYKGTFERKNP